MGGGQGLSPRPGGQIHGSAGLLSMTDALSLSATGVLDAWMLDPSDQLAARLARDGDPEPIDFEKTDSNFAIDWKGHYRIEGRAFVYTDRESGRVTMILGFPTAKIAQLG
jgi:hypothetical protein